MTNDILLSRPSLPRLAPLDELQPLTATAPAEIETLSPSTGRNRLESTTSSRFFPGGWFSSTTKLPEDGRTSLENATGEFAKAHESVAPSPAVEAPPATPVDGNLDDDKRNKGKWCVVM